MIVFFATASLSFLLSEAATLLADAVLRERIPLIGSFAGLERSLNPGIAFGIRLPIQMLITAAALCAVVAFAWRMRAFRYRQAAFGLIAGGALGNIVDRLADGTVTDYFQFGTFPVFNVADSFITIGVGLLLAEELWGKN